MKNKILYHIDTWLKLILKHFDKHEWQGTIFFIELGIVIMIWSCIVAIYIGQALQALILKG